MISVFGSDITEKEITSVKECMESQWLGLGKKVDEFETNMKSHLKAENFLMVDSGSNALYLAVKMLGLPPNSKIVLPSFTWVSCAHAIIMAGHIPVFADVDINTMNITRENIEDAMEHEKDIKAIMIVHYAGLSCEMDPIIDIGLPVIEDAAHAVLSTYNGKPCGTIGDIGIYSFDSMKNITTIDGGGMVFRSENKANMARNMRYCGISKSGFESAVHGFNKWWQYDINNVFIRMLPNNIGASIGIEQLKRSKEMLEKRTRVWNRYNEAFADVSWLKCPESEKKGDVHSRFTYAIRLPKRDELARFLLSNDVYTTLRYHPLHLNPIYEQQFRYLKNCKRLNDECLNIPIHPRLTDNDMEKIISLILDWGKYAI